MHMLHPPDTLVLLKIWTLTSFFFLLVLSSWGDRSEVCPLVISVPSPHLRFTLIWSVLVATTHASASVKERVHLGLSKLVKAINEVLDFGAAY